jgi:hypothetical protein
LLSHWHTPSLHVPWPEQSKGEHSASWTHKMVDTFLAQLNFLLSVLKEKEKKSIIYIPDERPWIKTLEKSFSKIWHYCFYWWGQNMFEVTLSDNFQYQNQFFGMRVTNWPNIQGQFSDPDYIRCTHQRQNVQFVNKSPSRNTGLDWNWKSGSTDLKYVVSCHISLFQ